MVLLDKSLSSQCKIAQGIMSSRKVSIVGEAASPDKGESKWEELQNDILSLHQTACQKDTLGNACWLR